MVGIEKAATAFDHLALNLIGAAGEYPSDIDIVTARDVQRLASSYLEQLAEFAPEATRVINARPANSIYVGLIAMAFPEAKFIHCIRNPNDATDAYCEARPYDLIAPADYDTLLSAHAALDSVLNHWSEVLPTGSLIRYESDMDLETVAQQLLN